MPEFTPEPLYAVTTAPTDDTGGYAAQFASGGHVVVWDASSNGGTTLQSFAQVFDAQGNAAGAPIRLFTDPAFDANGATVGGVATLADGSFVVLAKSEQVDSVNHSPPTWNFYQERLAADGAIVSAPTLAASYSSFDDPAAASGPVFAAPGGNSYYLQVDLTARYTNVGGTSATLKHYDLTGAAAGQDIVAGSLSFAFPDAAVLAGGNVVTASELGRYGQWVGIEAYDPSGNDVGHSQVGQSNYGEVNDVAPEVAALSNGNALLVSQHAEYDANTQSYSPAQWQVHVLDSSGQLVGDMHVLDAAAAAGAVHLESLAGGNVLAWWASGSSDVAQALDADGNAASAVFAIGTSVSAVTGTSDGGFLVESAVSGDIYEQKFDAVPAQSGGSTPGQLQVDGGVTPVPSGNYTITGGAGIDTIAFGGAHTQYDITPTSIGGPEGSDTLSGIERVEFGDGYAVAFDVNGDAGEAYRLYQAAFHRAPDLPGLGYHINDLDRGVPLWLVAQHFIDSPEFQATYGVTDNAQFVTLLYENVLHREPEAAGLQFHLNEFAQGESRADMLIHFSESPENQANVIGQTGSGMLYMPTGVNA
ncbi:MAG TPA: DUF4214 domain-containing protein [Ramlibacter sp.]